MFKSESTTFSRKNKYGNFDECQDPCSILQSQHYLQFETEQGANIQIASPVLADIVSIEIKEPDYRNPHAVFITISFDDGSILLGFFMKSGEYREYNNKCYKSFTQYDYFNYSETHIFHWEPEEGKTIDFIEVVNPSSHCFYEEYCWIIVSGGVVSLLKVDERPLLNIIHYPILYRPRDNINIFSTEELDFSKRLEGLGDVVGSCRIEASGRPVKITCEFQNKSGKIVLTVELEIFEANYEPEQDGERDGISCPEYRESQLREVGI